MLKMGFGGGGHPEPSLGAQLGEPGQRGNRRLAEPGVLGHQGGLDTDWRKGFLDRGASECPVDSGVLDAGTRWIRAWRMLLVGFHQQRWAGVGYPYETPSRGSCSR